MSLRVAACFKDGVIAPLVNGDSLIRADETTALGFVEVDYADSSDTSIAPSASATWTIDLDAAIYLINSIKVIPYTIPGEFTITVANATDDTFTVTGDATSVLAIGDTFVVTASGGNDGTYVVTGITFGTPSTVIEVDVVPTDGVIGFVDPVQMPCTFDIEVFQRSGDWTSLSGYADLVYHEEGITLISTKLYSVAAPSATTLTVNSSAGFLEYDLLFLAEDSDNFYYVDSVPSGTSINIKSALTNGKQLNCFISEVHEIKNLGLLFNRSSSDKLYIKITNRGTGITAEKFRVRLTGARLV